MIGKNSQKAITFSARDKPFRFHGNTFALDFGLGFAAFFAADWIPCLPIDVSLFCANQTVISVGFAMIFPVVPLCCCLDSMALVTK